MKNYRQIAFCHVLLALFISVGCILLYQKGFFVIKESLQNISEISPFQIESKGKVVLVIIDAMRFDFTLMKNETEIDQADPLKYFFNGLPIITELLREQPENTIHLKGYCDPPTVTTQRIKSIAIGNLPSFIEVLKTFVIQKWEQDSLLLQMQRNKLDVVHIGDDVWTGLFSDKFTKDYYTDSLDIYDYDSVDDLVIKHIYNEIANPKTKLIIAHFTGIDHMGHTQLNDKELTQKKLAQMNSELIKIMNALGENDVLISMGDHGMTQQGNHGGATQEETSTAIFGYSKRGFIKGYPKIKNYDKTYNTQTNQVDTLATLCMMLDLPIPFNNLGVIIPDFYPADTSLSIIFQGIWGNVQQIYNNVILVQQLNHKMNQEQFLFVANGFDELEILFKRASNESDKTLQENLQLQFIIKAKKYCAEVKEQCIIAWNHMNVILMLLSEIDLFICCFMILLMSMYLSLLAKLPELKHPSYNVQYSQRIKFLLILAILITILSQIIFSFDVYLMLALVILWIVIFGIYYFLTNTFHLKHLLAKKYDIKTSLYTKERIFSSRFLIFSIYVGFNLYTMNSCNFSRQEDNQILLAMSFSMIVECFYHFRHGGMKDKRHFFSLLGIPPFLYLAQYFDVTQTRIYVYNQIRFDSIMKIMNVFINAPIIFPAAGLYFYFLKKEVFPSKLSRGIFKANYAVVVVYFLMLDRIHESHIKTLCILLPKISYVLLIVNVIVVQITAKRNIGKENKNTNSRNNPEYQQLDNNNQNDDHKGLNSTTNPSKQKVNPSSSSIILAHIITINVSLLMLIGTHAFYLSFFFHIALKLFVDYAVSHGNLCDYASIQFLMNIIQYFFLVSGHKGEIPSLHIHSAYVGFDKYNHFISGFLLSANTYSFLILGFFIVQYFNRLSLEKVAENQLSLQQVQTNQFEEIKQHTSQKERQSKTYSGDLQIREMSHYSNFLMLVLAMLAASGVNCLFNRDSPLLPSEFGPRFLFDNFEYFYSVVYIFIILLVNTFF